MGNSYSRDFNLIIYIQTEKEYYNSGSNVSGVVFVQAKDNFKFDALYIRVQGDQYCEWLEGSSKNRMKHTGSQNFYSQEHLLQKYGGALQKGRYAYPFSMELSQNIPGSFNEEKDAKIQYKLAAYFVNYHQPNNKEIQYIPLHIREPFRQELIAYQGASVQQPSTCHCCSKGTVQLQAKFDKNICSPGQSVRVDIRVDNSLGTSQIDKVYIELVRNVFMSANSGIHRTIQNIAQKQVVPVNARKGQAKQVTHHFRVNDPEYQTAIGTLVANHYRLEVSTKVGAISSDNPCVYSPLFILRENPMNLKQVSRPINLSRNIQDYRFEKMKLFRAPQYWYKKNMNLDVMNFRLEDGAAD